MASALYKRGLRSQFIQRIDGAIVLPAYLADEIAGEAFEMTAFEDFDTEEVRNGRGIFGLYPATSQGAVVSARRKETR